jgi:hypothetical protein
VNDNTVETFTTDDGRHRIRIVSDYEYSVTDLRDASNAAQIVYTDGYVVGDREPDDTEREAMERGGWPLLKRYLELSQHAIATMRIGAYVHSGITIYPIENGNDGGYRGPDAEWDHALVGFAYVTREAADELGIPGAKGGMALPYTTEDGTVIATVADEAARQMRAEIEEVDDVLTGNVYGFVIEKCETWRKDSDPDDTDDRWEEIEDGSCFGFVGETEYAMAEAKATLDSELAREAKTAAAVPA